MEQSDLQQDEESDISIMVENAKIFSIQMLPATATDGSQQDDVSDCQYVIQIPSCSENGTNPSFSESVKLESESEMPILIDDNSMVVEESRQIVEPTKQQMQH